MLDEAQDYFVEDFLTLFEPGVSSPDPVAHRALLEIVDVLVLRQELKNEIRYFRDWIYHQDPNYGKYYMRTYEYGTRALSSHGIKEYPLFPFPDKSVLGVRCYVTLHSTP